MAQCQCNGIGTFIWDLCHNITMVQGQCNGVGTSICDLYQVCCTTISNDWAHMTINTMHLPPGFGPGYVQLCSIWGGGSCVLPLPLLTASIMVIEYSFLTNTKCVATLGSNGWAHITLNTMHIPLTVCPGCRNIVNILYLGWWLVAVVCCHYHGSRPI